MRSFIPIASCLLWATTVLAQSYDYGSGSGYGSSGASYGSGDNGGKGGSSDKGGSDGIPPTSVEPVAAVASTSSPESSSTTSSESGGSVKVHVVKVSNKKGELKLIPNDLKASPGDMVQFQFYPKVCLPYSTPAATWLMFDRIIRWCSLRLISRVYRSTT